MAADIRALTGIRGAAAGVIVLYHYGHVSLFNGGELSYYPIPHGYLPVDLFFMLSGFVIALTYKNAFDSDRWKSFAVFMLKRVARLYPAYLAIGVLYVLKIVFGLAGPAKLSWYSLYDAVGNLLMLTGWGLHVNPLMGVSWAASAEMGSYLLVPLLILLIIKNGAWLCVVTTVAALLGIVAVNFSGHGEAGPLDVVAGDSFYPLVRAIAGFVLGMVIYRFSDIVDRLSMTAQDILLALTLIAIFVTALVTSSDLPIYALFVALVLLLSRDGWLALLLFGNAPIYRLGIISYSIYLIHPLFVSLAVAGWRQFGQTPMAYILSSAGCFVIIWLLSELSYRLVEMPGRKFIVDLAEPKSKPELAKS